VNFIPNSEGSLALFLLVVSPMLSAIGSLQECSSLFEELKGSTAFAGYAVGRRLCTYPYFNCRFYFSISFAASAGHLCEFHTEQ
jgi:hypothetical protein